MSEFLESIDHWLFFWINNRWSSPALDPIFQGLSELGAWTICLVAVALLYYQGRRALLRHLLLIIVYMTAGSLMNQTLKNLVRRARPMKEFREEIAAGTVHVNVREADVLKRRSFPSGHSMLAFFLMVYVGQVRRSTRACALLLAAGVAIARVYVGAHFPFDCLAGAVLGAAWGLLAWLAHERLQRTLWKTA